MDESKTYKIYLFKTIKNTVSPNKDATYMNLTNMMKKSYEMCYIYISITLFLVLF